MSSAGLPADVAEGAHESPAVAIDAGRGLGQQGAALVDTARESFVVGQRYALILGGVAAVLGALYVWRAGPTRHGEAREEALDDAQQHAQVGGAPSGPAFEPSLAD
jgi:hypothetical protein